MNDWPDSIGIAIAYITLICFAMGFPIVVMKYQDKVDHCHAHGGRMVDTTKGWVCTKLEIIK